MAWLGKPLISKVESLGKVLISKGNPSTDLVNIRLCLKGINLLNWSRNRLISKGNLSIDLDNKSIDMARNSIELARNSIDLAG